MNDTSQAQPATPRVRAEDWPQRLAAYLEARKATAWERGVHDCGGFARSWVKLATGHDPFDVIGHYLGRAEAVALLRSYGGIERVMDHWAAAAGVPEIARAFARRGDIGLARGRGEAAVGIVVEQGLAVAEEAGGYSVLPAEMIARAWRIG